MKRIDAIIRPENLEEVKERLGKSGFERFTLTEIRGIGKQKCRGIYRGVEHDVVHPGLLLTIIAPDEHVETIMGAIMRGARTGHLGDGKIFVTALDEVVRIRTGEIDSAAF